jgi:hypothetical protein
MRIVIGYDQGAPAELVRDSLIVGKALMERGHVVIFVVADPVAFVDQAAGWTPDELHQAPVLHAAPHLVMKRGPVDGFADQMAAAGYDDKQTLITLATIWNRQLELLKPDLIVGLSTPLLWLIGPTHAPTVALGNGMALPPILGSAFPRLSVESAPLADEDVMLANANAMLGRLGKPSLAMLSDVLAGCTAILYGLPAFDPYLQLRRAITSGLLGDQPNPAVPPTEPRLAAFLDVYCPGIEMMVLALAGFDQGQVDVHISGATTSMRRFLEQQPHIKVWNDHAALLHQAASASAFVHHGAQDVAQRCLTVGRPQLIIPWTREQDILNYMIGWMSFSWMKPPTIQIDEMASTLRDLLRDTSLMVAAQHHARQLANSNMPDALPSIIERIESLARPARRAEVHAMPLDAAADRVRPLVRAALA